MKSILTAFLLYFCNLNINSNIYAQEKILTDYNVLRTTPYENAWGSIPIGNGDIGANVWVEPNGDLILLLSKTDSWDEVSLLCKLRRIRIKLPSTEEFRQELRLAEGEILISGGNITTHIWIDANNPVIHIDMEGSTKFTTSVTHETWRTKERLLQGGKIRSCWGLAKPFYLNEKDSTIHVYPDSVLENQNNRIVYIHRNPSSAWEYHMRLQKMDAFIKQESDPLLYRTFRAVVKGKNMTNNGKCQLTSKSPSKKQHISISVLTVQKPTIDTWVKQINEISEAAESIPTKKAKADHIKWWQNFWNHSWIYADRDTAAQTVTRGYTLQRWMNACAGRGAYPIKFNGSIFNVECVQPVKSYCGICNFDADFREWGDPYWFQNTRLIYWTMPMAGDYDLMLPMIKMYSEALPLRKHATKTYFNHDGAFFPEILEFWGTSYGKRDTYQWDPKNNKSEQLWWGNACKDILKKNNRAGLPTPPGWYWQSGIELTTIMLTYYEHTNDPVFLNQTLLPFAKEILTFNDQHWPRKENGKLHFFPISSIEAIQNATNPMPDVAGLHFILPKLIECESDENQKAAWQKMYSDLPPLPIGGEPDKQRLLTAEKAERHSDNGNPEFYFVFPYTLYGVGMKNIDLALNAWPKEWDVKFKLHAPKNTTVEFEHRAGKIVKLQVIPASRRKNIKIIV